MKKCIAIIVFFFISSCLVFSQTSEQEFNNNQKIAFEYIKLEEYEKAIPILEANLVYLNEFESELFKFVDLYYQHLIIANENIGNIQRTNFYLEKIIELYEKYLDKVQNRNDIIFYLKKLSNRYSDYLNLTKSLEINNKIIESIRSISVDEFVEDYFIANSNKANLLNSLSLYEESELQHISNLEEIETRVGINNEFYVYELINFGKLLKEMNYHYKSIENIVLAIEISNRIKAKDLELQAKSILNEIYSSIGFNDKVISLEKEIIASKEKIFGKHSKEVYLSKMNMVEFYINSHKIDSALLLQDSIMMKLDSVFGNWSSVHLANLSNTIYILALNQKYDEALQMCYNLLNILQINSEIKNASFLNILNRIVSIQFLQGRYTEAANTQKQICEMSCNLSQKQCVKSKINLQFINNHIKKYTENDSIFETFLAENINCHKTSIFGLSEIEISSTNSKMYYNELIQSINYAFFRYSINKNLVFSSLNSQLNYKSLSLNIQREIQEELTAKNNKKLTEQFQEWKSIKRELAKLYELSPDELKSRGINLEEKENEANLIEQQLSKQLKSFAYKDRTFRWEDIQEKLNEDEVFIEMLRLPVFDFNKMQKTDSVTYVAYIIKKESSKPEIVLLTNGRELEGDLFQDYYANTTNRRSETAVLTGNSYEHFWKEIQTRVGVKKKVFIALDGVFNKLNLNTLYNTDEKKYLLETIEINYVTNTIDFIKKPRNSETSLISWKDAVLFGNPNFNQIRITNGNNERSLFTSRDIPSFCMDSLTRGMVVKDLPQTKVEIENISKILEKSKVKVNSYLENEATEEHIKQVKSPSILHIATHGYFFEDDLHPDFEEEKYFGLERKQFNMNPMLRSGLLLAGVNETMKNNTKSTGENGILTSLEASYLNLEQTDLVVLSACETGLGKIQNGVGVYGLQKSMKDAGAKNVIMSLWKVDDKVAQEFMTLFYTKLMSGQTIKQAFTKTQLEMKEKYPQPFFWGAFILSEN
jgi:CHAT domain-containing protein